MDGEEESEPDEGDDAEADAEVADATEADAEAADAGGDDGLREIPHDEFEPTGTFAIAFLYLGLLAALWLFVYFVEFLGRGPTVVG